MTALISLKKELLKLSDVNKRDFLPRFFKTGKGQYGEGDVFIGVTVPKSRLVAKQYLFLKFSDLKELLNSEIHEERLVALFVLVDQFKKEKDRRKEIFDFYLKHKARVNNWDLVDSSAPYIVGGYLLDKADRGILVKLAKSASLWNRRIAIVATMAFIKEGNFKDTFEISEILLEDKEDLIHKAVGWMLREVGKKDQGKLEEFLKNHYKKIPRTALRYAIERFDETKRRKYIEGKI